MPKAWPTQDTEEEGQTHQSLTLLPTLKLLGQRTRLLDKTRAESRSKTPGKGVL